MKKKMKQEFTIQQGGQNYGFIENTNTLYNMCNVRHYGHYVYLGSDKANGCSMDLDLYGQVGARATFSS